MVSAPHGHPHLIGESSGPFIAVYKPSGYLVHPVGDGTPDMVEWLAENAPVSAGDFAFAHRLDKGVSGVLVGSASGERRAALSGALSERTTEKAYAALVYGITRPKGTIRRALKDGRRGKALDAVTRYRRLHAANGLSLLLVRPETGRKHQIRRHLQSIGHAIVGDARYGARKPKPVRAFPGRLWLHGLSLTWPEQDLRWCANLADELASHLDALDFPREAGLFPEVGG